MSRVTTDTEALKLRWGNEWKSRQARLSLNVFFHFPFTWGLKEHPMYNGRLDLRGLPLPGAKTLKRTNLSNVDLSYSDLHLWWIQGCHFTNVLLVGADLSNLRDHGNRWEHVDFSDANLSASGLGFRHSVYEGCSFHRTRFAKTVFCSPVFKNCTLRDCKSLRGVDFNASAFEHCAFDGPLDDVIFRNGFLYPADEKRFGHPAQNSMRSVDWACAQVGPVGFSGGVQLDTLILPSDQLLVRTLDLPRLLEVLKVELSSGKALAPDELKELKAMVEVLETYAHPGSSGHMPQQHYIIDFAICEESLGSESARNVYNVVHDAEVSLNQGSR
jgi:uncharacterized protein YjbI with pentapeptide repeats